VHPRIFEDRVSFRSSLVVGSPGIERVSRLEILDKTLRTIEGKKLRGSLVFRQVRIHGDPLKIGVRK
jgi:hypothetical protein